MRRSILALILVTVAAGLMCGTLLMKHRENRDVRSSVQLESSSVAQLPGEARLLPVVDPTAEAIHATFEPHYTQAVKRILSKEDRESLEASVLTHLRWLIKPDINVYSARVRLISGFWSDSPLPDSYRVAETAYEEARAAMVGGPSERIGFATPPFEVSRAPITAVLSDPSMSYGFQRNPDHFSEDLIVVRVFYVKKVVGDSGALYRPIETTFVINPKNKSRLFFDIKDVHGKPFAAPAVEVPAFLNRGVD